MDVHLHFNRDADPEPQTAGDSVALDGKINFQPMVRSKCLSSEEHKHLDPTMD